MTQCSDYEVELSAIFDGESDPATALELLEHVASCPSCAAFARDLRTMQANIDLVYVAPGPEPIAVLPLERRRRPIRVTRWAWGLAAAAVVAVGLSYGVKAALPGGVTGAERDRQVVIRLEENRGAMSDERFIAIVTELLRADRKYQYQMYAVLEALNERDVPNEADIVSEAHRARETAAARQVAATSTQPLN